MSAITQDEQLLSESFRVQVIKEIFGPENQARKARIKKMYDILKDKTKQYVLEQIKKEYQPTVVAEIENRTANISIARKITDKKSVVYKDGVIRSCEDEVTQMQIDKVVSLINLDSKMKKVNRFVEYFRNTAAFVRPYKCPMSQKYKYSVVPMMPVYDVIEDSENREIPRVYILSYVGRKPTMKYMPENMDGIHDVLDDGLIKRDGVDQIIADAPADQGADQEEFLIWWSNKFHFTTNKKGEIVSGPDIINPISRLPFVNLAKNQDGFFWAEGGDDLIDASILINLLLTDIYYIAKYQGMGIFYATGKGLPEEFNIGPRECISVKVEEGDPQPNIGFASSNPPIGDHMSMIEQYLAFLLSTNDLEPGTVSGSLSATNAESGIQEMIKRSDLQGDIEDQREIYRDAEPEIFNIIARWHNLYYQKGLLDQKFAKLGPIDEEQEIYIKFLSAQPFMSEKEKLEVLQVRRDLGIDSMIDTMIRDNPDLDKNDAQKKIIEILKEKIQMARMRMIEGVNNGIESDIQDADNSGEDEEQE